ncbi:DUF2267 domain-containing protein [Streptomyces sp. NPDC088354]|uniref:DUF2267 domain-containing protein n=1 Tax=Streptomyces sp. NPDC088354 TaxID=3365856 RepID=UPI00381EF475
MPLSRKAPSPRPIRTQRTGLSRQEAADLTWATLETLAHGLSPGEARDLNTELPEGLAEAVRTGTTDRMVRSATRRMPS